MMIEKVKNTIVNNGLIQKGEHIVIGLSGGPDSVCLFHVLFRLKEELKLTLHAVHINHQFRPGAAEEDQEYVEMLCENYHVPCHSFVYDVNRIAKERGITGEEAGRLMRYQSFYEIAQSLEMENVKIAVAQNLNDQAETLLMRILRGTGTDGLAGIEYKRTGEGGFEIIRPLLDITRKEIEDYCKDQELQPQIDLTNLQPIYTRNKVRLELIPYLQKNYNENIMIALNRLSKIAKEDKDYLNNISENMINEYAKVGMNNIVSMELGLLREMHPAIRNRVLLKLFSRIGLVKDITAIHLEAASNMILDGNTSANIDFPKGYGIRISYETVEIYKKNEDSFQDHELNRRLEAKLVKGTDNYMVNQNLKAFDYEEVKKSGCEPILRYRKSGDWIRPSGMVGTKKIQDFFVDAKIKKEERNTIPLVCLGSEVIWIIGHRVSENYKVKEKTQDILLLEYNVSI